MANAIHSSSFKDEGDITIPKKSHNQKTTITILPTHVLLHLFSFIHEHFHCIVSMNFSDMHLMIKRKRPRVLSIEILIASQLYRDENFLPIVLNDKFKDIICPFMTKYNDIKGLKWADKFSLSLEVQLIGRSCFHFRNKLFVLLYIGLLSNSSYGR